MDWSTVDPQSLINLVLPILSILISAGTTIYTISSNKGMAKMNYENEVKFYKLKYRNENFVNSINNYLRATSKITIGRGLIEPEDLGEYSKAFGSLVYYANNNIFDDLKELHVMISLFTVKYGIWPKDLTELNADRLVMRDKYLLIVRKLGHPSTFPEVSQD